MPKTRNRKWGDGKSCLVVGGPNSARQFFGGALRGVGFRVVPAEDSRGDLLDREPVTLAVAFGSPEEPAVEALLARAKRRHPEVPVVIVGTTATYEEAVAAMRKGAADFLPERVAEDVLLVRLRHLVEGLESNLPASPPPKVGEYAGLLGASEAMRSLYSTIDKVSRYKTNVLLLGESGTGKELVARALHAHGPRRSHLFVPLNCATLGRDLLENELFGHDRGAYTGANEKKKGLFELADGGTLFLDEIAEMDPATQAKLLRVLERNEFRRVGGTEKIKVDLSVIAATNRNIVEAIASGKFREDLYYRLKVVAIVIAPLRDRKEDIPALIEHFIADFNRRNAGKIKSISPQALKVFMENDWPGNVRELKNAIEGSAVLASGDTLGAEGAFTTDSRQPSPRAQGTPAAAVPSPSSVQIQVGTTIAEAERRLILATTSSVPSRADAAQILGIGLRTLYFKLRAYQRSDSHAPAPKSGSDRSRRSTRPR